MSLRGCDTVTSKVSLCVSTKQYYIRFVILYTFLKKTKYKRMETISCDCDNHDFRRKDGQNYASWESEDSVQVLNLFGSFFK